MECRWPHSEIVALYDSKKKLIITFHLKEDKDRKSHCNIIYRSDGKNGKSIKKFVGIATPPYIDEFNIHCSYYCQESSRLCFLSPITEQGYFKLLAMDHKGKIIDSQTFNIKTAPGQWDYMQHCDFHVRHQWQVFSAHPRPYSIVEWPLCGTVQVIYLTLGNEPTMNLHIRFFDLSQTWPMSEAVSLFNGYAQELVVHMKDGEKHFLRVCDYPYGNSLTRHLMWLGDIQLVGQMENKKLTFKNVVPLGMRFNSYDSEAESYLIEYSNEDDPSVPYLQVVRFAYRTRPRTSDRMSEKNFYTETMNFPHLRYLDIQEIEHSWQNISVIPLQALSSSLIPHQIAVLNAQKLENCKKRLKLSLKCLMPQHPHHPEWPARDPTRILHDVSTEGHVVEPQIDMDLDIPLPFPHG